MTTTVQTIHSTDLGAGLEIAAGKVVPSASMTTDAELVAASASDLAAAQADTAAQIAADNAVEAAAATAEDAAALLAHRRARYLSLVQTCLQNSATWEVIGNGVKFYGDPTVGLNRLISIGVGKSDVASSEGFMNIHPPAVNTVIKGLGCADVVVDANGFIQLNPWGTLFYKMPVGASGAYTQGEWYHSAYNQSNFDVPDDLIYIGGFNDDLGGPVFKLWDGTTLTQGVNRPDTAWFDAAPYFVNGVSDYGGIYQTVRVRRQGNRVYIEGLMQGLPTGHVMTLPAGFAPKAKHIFIGSDNTGVSRIDVDQNGKVTILYDTAGQPWCPMEFSYACN